MAGKRPTVADIRANKGKRQYTMLRTETMEELEAAKRPAWQWSRCRQP